uniref:Uncharacterized protein n=1 Tax=Anopheles christyi TaxID=43041 RepID=A0A182KIR1_9DIPT
MPPKKTVKIVTTRSSTAGPSSTAIPVKAGAKKSRYKIYEIPRKSEFCEYLEKLRREQERQHREQDANGEEGAGPSRQAETRLKLIVFDEPITTAIRQGSVVEYRPKERLPFKDVVSSYLRRSSNPRLMIGQYKIPKVKSWEQVIEDSLRKISAERASRAERWKQPRLQWLEELEEANHKLPERNRSQEGRFDPSLCCFLMWCQRRRHNHQRLSNG